VQALRSRATTHEETTTQPVMNKAWAYRQGLISNLLNPKIGVFYTTLLPQFIGPGQPVFLTSILLAALFALIGAIWLTIYVLLLSSAGAFFRRPSVQQAMERVTGVVLIGLGIRLAIEQR